MDYSALKAELENDPENLGYQGKTDQQAADLMNALSRPHQKYAPVEDAYLYLVKRMKWKGIEAAAQNAEHAASEAAYAAVKIVSGPVKALNFMDPVTEGIFTAFVATGLLTEQHKQELMALSATTRSRAEELAFGNVEIWDIARARAL